MVFLVKKDVQSYTITLNKYESNVAASACERFGIIRDISISILRLYARDEIMGFHISSISRYYIFYSEPLIDLSDTMNCLINEKFFLRQFLKFWIATAYLQCDILSTKSHSGFRWPAILLSSRWPCRPRIFALYWGSSNQFNIGGRFGLFSEAWQTQRGVDGSGWVRCWWSDQNTRDIAKKMSSTIKTNTLCHQWLSRRYKRGAFDIGRNIMEQFSASLPH